MCVVRQGGSEGGREWDWIIVITHSKWLRASAAHNTGNVWQCCNFYTKPPSIALTSGIWTMHGMGMGPQDLLSLSPYYRAVLWGIEYSSLALGRWGDTPDPYTECPSVCACFHMYICMRVCIHIWTLIYHIIEFHWFKAVKYIHAYSTLQIAHSTLLGCSCRFYACAVT